MKNQIHNSNKIPIQRSYQVILSMILLLLLAVAPAVKARAAEASAITFGTINYEALTLQVFNNNNKIVYYSTDNTNWDELEATYDSATSSYTMDISWVSMTTDTTLYFKGDKYKTAKSIMLPMQNSSISVDYDKVIGEFTFSDVDDSRYFEWRKLSDYEWTKVSLVETSNSYLAFMDTMETFRTKGAKIAIRTPQAMGSGASSVGTRPSVEVTITIPSRRSAPSLKVNSSKLTINTTTAMEYYDSTNGVWIECESGMSLEDIAPKCLYENGGSSVTLKIREEETTSAPYSNTTTITIPGQAAAPTIGGSAYDITYYYLNGKLVLQFNKASATEVYEYAIVRSTATLSISNANWKKVSNNSLMTLSSITVPDGSTIYVRKKGTDADTEDGIALVLSSAVGSFTVTY